ncbi:MAG: OsmC family protein [Fibrobacterales bacterium]
MVEVTLKRDTGYKFVASNATGHEAVLDGPAKIGGTDDGLRPMEMVLMGLAGCSSFDLLSILEKQRQTVEDLEIKVQGSRVDTVPSVYDAIHLIFNFKGDIDPAKLERALALAVDKYCSVAEMLKTTVKISYEYTITQ